MMAMGSEARYVVDKGMERKKFSSDFASVVGSGNVGTSHSWTSADQGSLVCHVIMWSPDVTDILHGLHVAWHVIYNST